VIRSWQNFSFRKIQTSSSKTNFQGMEAEYKYLLFAANIYLPEKPQEKKLAYNFLQPGP